VSVELIEDLIVELKEGDLERFPSLVYQAIELSFVNEVELADIFDMEMSDLEELLDYGITDQKKYTTYRARLVKHLKKEKDQYKHLYYSQRA
jgi:uncharacterized protein YqgQ